MYHMIDCFILYDIDRMRKYRKTRRMRKTRHCSRKHRGGNTTLGLHNRKEFNNFMKAHLSSPNNLKKLTNTAAYHPANSSVNSQDMQNNSANMNMRRPATIRTPIERPISSPQGYQGLRNFQNTLLANQRLRRA
jgi:hypothetical protein